MNSYSPIKVDIKKDKLSCLLSTHNTNEISIDYFVGWYPLKVFKAQGVWVAFSIFLS